MSSAKEGTISNKELPGNPELPSSHEELMAWAGYEKETFKYSVADFLSKPRKDSFAFSPDGRYFSFREKDQKSKSHVYVKDTENGKTSRVLEEDKDIIRDYTWADNNTIIYTQDNGGDENYGVYAVNANGENNRSLAAYDKVRVTVISILRELPERIIIQMNKDNAQVFEPYDLNIVSGELTKLFENKDPSNPITEYYFDRAGELKAYTILVKGKWSGLFYKNPADGSFNEVNSCEWSQQFHILGFDYNSENPNYAYILSNTTQDKTEILHYDLLNKKTLKVLFKNKEFDLDGIYRSIKRNYEIDYYHFHGERLEIVPVSETFKILHERFKSRFSNYQYKIVDRTDDELKYLLLISSDRNAAEYYLYDTEQDSYEKLVALRPQLSNKDMASMRPVKFETRDGLSMHAYLTIPDEASTDNKVPLIVNVHGGPYGVRDYWGFRPDVQLFASRGYATLQVNYRGSGGYGMDFMLEGAKQIGRKMLDDLEDGVSYALKNGIIDPERIAIFGGSYGGLATLGSLIKTPELYSCGVDFVGVSNLFTFVDSIPPYWEPYLEQIRQLWYDFDNPEEKEIMKEVSPALNAEKIRKPLFVIQGANDPRVNINESDQIVENVRSLGFDVPYMVKYNEGHGFAHEQNNIEFGKVMMGFFARYLKP